MYLHIGGSRVLRADDLLGIFDVRMRDRQCNREFLQVSVQDGREGGKAEYKSFVVTTGKVYFSPIAPGTLKKRLQSNVFDRE
ncbi:MAG: DUF370 domain-containing protein [Firmicutes bacterium]|nr:DUF370 domain-containing protein [Bacillota bacterium]